MSDIADDTLEAGTRITCENDHLVTTLKQPLSPDQHVSVDHFNPMECGMVAEAGEIMQPCPQCGGAWFGMYGAAGYTVMNFHVEGRGWTPNTDTQGT